MLQNIVMDKWNGKIMGAVYFTREITNSIIIIAEELKRTNDLKEQELQLKYSQGYKKMVMENDPY